MKIERFAEKVVSNILLLALKKSQQPFSQGDKENQMRLHWKYDEAIEGFNGNIHINIL